MSREHKPKLSITPGIIVKFSNINNNYETRNKQLGLIKYLVAPDCSLGDLYDVCFVDEYGTTNLVCYHPELTPIRRATWADKIKFWNPSEPI